MNTIAKLFLMVMTTILFSNTIMHAQAPQSFPYQAVARGSSGNLLSSQTISIRISILDGSSTGTVVYQETQTVTTNALGLLNLNIGQGTILGGVFANINWGSGSKYIKIEMDPSGGSSYVVMGTTQLLSVPYAIYSNKSGNAPTLDLAYDMGGKGQGRFINADSGAVKIQGEDGLLVTGIYNTGDDIEASGAGVRMLFNPKKAAFRAGGAASSEWDKDSTGNYSVGLGFANKAKGDYSFSTGYLSNANGETSIAMGVGTKANAISSVAIGSNTQANGINSTAIGRNTKANGLYSTSIGNQTIANGSSSTSIGDNTQANGYGSFVAGMYNDTIVSSQTSSASTTPLFIIGNGNFGSPSNAMVVRKDGNVGIGTNAPATKLDVAGQVKISGGNPGVGKVLTSDANGLASWATPATPTSSINGTTNYIVKFSSATSGGNSQLIDDGTNIGIGNATTTPQSKVHVNSTNNLADFRITNSTTGIGVTDGLVIYNQGNQASVLNKENGALDFGTNNTTRLTIDATGNVGVGTSTPSTKFEVNGQIRMIGGNPGSGKVMSSDATGLASWTDLPSYQTWNKLITADQATTIYDSMYHLGNITIGGNQTSDASLTLLDSLNDNALEINVESNPLSFQQKYGIRNTMNTNYNKTGIYNLLQGNGGTIDIGVSNRHESNSSANQFGVYNAFASTASTGSSITGVRNWFQSTSSYTGWITGVENLIQNNNNNEQVAVRNDFTGIGTGLKYGALNTFAGTGGSTFYGISTTISTTGNGDHYGSYQLLSSTGNGTKYGTYINIPSTSGGNHFGVYSDVTKSSGYAGYFLGRVSIGNTNTTNYILPLSRGTNGQIMKTDGTGNVTWIDASTIASGTLDQAYNFGGAGAGRIITATNGVVKISGEDGFQVTGTKNAGDDLDLTGSGTYMFFNPKKAAFRAGYSTSNTIPKDSIGDYSFSGGYIPKSKGESSTAFGWACNALADNSFAAGKLTTANGLNSTALGNQTIANGESSVSIGSQNVANGLNALATGKSTQANGESSTSMGFYTEANGSKSTSLGNRTIANGFASTVIGQFNDTIVSAENSISSTTPLFVVGNGVDDNNRSNAVVVRNDGNVGISANIPRSKLFVNGAIALKLSKENGSTAVTLDNTASVWYFTAVGSSIVLPAANTCSNRIYTIVNSTSVAKSISAFTNFSGGTSTTVPPSSSIDLISDGTDWLKIR